MPSEYDDGDTPVDLSPDVLDEAAEELAVSGPVDNAREVTPTLVAGCRECNGSIAQVGEWRPPTGPDEAWAHWRQGCVVSIGAEHDWTFCPVTGIATIDGQRRNFDRRREPHAQPRPREWTGPERRRRT